MCNKHQAGALRYPGRVTMLVNICVLALFVTAIGPAASAQSVSGDIYNASNNVIIQPTPTPMPTVIPAWNNLSGFVLDSSGNKVAGAYVILYVNGGTAPIANNPTYTGTDAGSGYGEYNFTGLQPGNYTVYVEKSDIYLYNSSATIMLTADIDTRLNVIINGYVLKPMVTAAPSSLTTMEPIATVTPSMAPSQGPTGDIFSTVKERALWPIIVLVIALGGVGFMILRARRKPKIKKSPLREAPNAGNKVASIADKSEKAAESTLKISPEYAAEIEDLASTSTISGYGDIAVLNRINALSKKYGVDQSTIFSDIKKSKGRNPLK